MPRFIITVRTQRLVEEEYAIDADTKEDAIEAFHEGDGYLQDECIIDCTDGPTIIKVEDCGGA